MEYRYTAIVLGKKDVGEADRIYTFFTREAGLIRAVGKSVRKPTSRLAGFLEPVTETEIIVAKNKGLGKIAGADSVRNFFGIKSDLETLSAVMRVFDIFRRMVTDEEKDERIFFLLEEFLLAMENVSPDPESAHKKEVLELGFVFKLFGELGYQLEMGKCSHCGNQLSNESVFFSAARGGVLCHTCLHENQQAVKISEGVVKAIRVFRANSVGSLAKLVIGSRDLNLLKLAARDLVNWNRH